MQYITILIPAGTLAIGLVFGNALPPVIDAKVDISPLVSEIGTLRSELEQTRDLVTSLHDDIGSMLSDLRKKGAQTDRLTRNDQDALKRLADGRPGKPSQNPVTWGR